MIREEHLIITRVAEIEHVRAVARAASCSWLNGLVMQLPDDLDLIQIGDIIRFRFDDEVVRRLARLGEAQAAEDAES